jgi:glycosyltransferase involved in cell wall biosynthesis
MGVLHEASFTVFVGVFQGEPYLDSVLDQLKSQLDQNFKIVVVDNASTDESWDLIQGWQKIFGSRIRLVKNEINLGGGGSLHKSIHSNLITTTWFTAFHQDDFYLPNHVLELRKAISNCDIDEIAVFTSMGSMKSTGETQASHPRISWLTKNNSAQSAFLLNLRSQTLSWPSTAFKTEDFRKCFRSWHSPAFSDTEATLLMCGHGRFKAILRETMRYRENPFSESHVVENIESKISMSISLTRVLNSPEFVTILNSIDIKNRANFFLAVTAGLEVRLGRSPLNSFLKILTAEQCAQAWSFADSTSASFLAIHYEAMGSKFTSNLLDAISRGDDEAAPSDLRPALKDALEFLADRGVTSTLETIDNGKGKHRSRILLQALPLRLRVILFRVYVHVRAIRQPDYIWNTRWK